MSIAVVVFTRDLRIHDQPAVAAACAGAERVVPAFILDDAILASRFHRPNRARFLVDSLADVDGALRKLGSALVVRRGPWAAEVLRLASEVGATEVHVADDVSNYARTRLAALYAAADGERVAVHRHDALTVVPPGAVRPAESDHYRVFTPYYRRWLDHPWRRPVGRPDRITSVDEVDGMPLTEVGPIITGATSPGLIRGGESEARRRLNAWTRTGLREFEDRHDDLAGDATSHMGAFLHFGCISPLEMASKLRDRPGGAAFVRQLCWRDFFCQVLAARPDASWGDYRTRHDSWHVDDAAFEAWRDGRTGYPVVDAAMRQLTREAFMHNRARMVVASFLTKDLYVDWRHGARHFLDWLVDGDVANNNLNWQWTAGTGTDTNPHRVLNPTRQGIRFDPAGDYVRRYVPELSGLAGAAAHDPDESSRRACGYPMPIVNHHEAIAAYKSRFSAR